MSPSDIAIHTNLGRLPAFWDRRTVFVANLKSLFFENREETRALVELVGAIDTYGNRLYPILGLLFRRCPNLLVLERAPDPALTAYFEEVLGLSLPDLLLIGHDRYRAMVAGGPPPGSEPDAFDHIADHPAERIDGFVTDQDLTTLADRAGKTPISSQLGSADGNNKLLLHQYLESAGLPIFDTRIAHCRMDVAGGVEALRRLGYPTAVIKAQIGASGIGMIKVPTDAAPDVPAYLFHDGPGLVQGWLDESVEDVQWIGSPSIQLFVEPNTVHLYDLTDQILDEGSVHEGNIAPPAWLNRIPEAVPELVRQAGLVGRWLLGRGYRGTGSVDFHVIQQRGNLEIRVCEVNARVTGATYPSILARRFAPEGAWLMRNLRFADPLRGNDLLIRLNTRNILYRPGRPRGVLPVNFNLDAKGRTVKGQFLCLGPDQADVEDVLREAGDAMGVRWGFERD